MLHSSGVIPENCGVENVQPLSAERGTEDIYAIAMSRRLEGGRGFCTS